MDIISLEKVGEDAAVRAALLVLKQGGVVAVPTETTYGLACDPRNEKALARIYQIKGRDAKKPVLLVAASVAQVKKVAKLAGKSAALAKQFWPGALTLVLPSIVAAKPAVAIRVSSSPFIEALTRRFGYPIVSTSANRSGEPEGRSGNAVMRMFASRQDQPDLLVDAGLLSKNKPSTVARVLEDGQIEVLRQGDIELSSSV